MTNDVTAAGAEMLRAKSRSQDTPGAGSYDPNLAAVEPGNANAGASMRSKAQRFTSDKHNTDLGVGPGAYDPRHLVGGQRSTTAGKVADQVMLGGSATFRSDSIRQMEYN